MSSTRAARKRQTRLAFTPLPSSSPATKGYHKQIRDRAAAVSLDVSPSPAKRRKLSRADSDDSGLLDVQEDEANDSIPTPAASLQRPPHDGIDLESQSDDEPVRSTQRRADAKDKLTSQGKSRQRQLDFSNYRDPDSFSSPIRLTSSAKPQSSTRSSMFNHRSSGKVVDISSDESEVLLPLPKVTAQSKSKLKEENRNEVGRSTRSSQKPIIVESESEGENIVVSSGPPEAVDPESEDDDDIPTTIGTQRRKRARRGSRNSFIASSPPQIVDSDDDLEIIERPKKRRHRDSADLDDDESQSEAEPVTPRRKLKRGRQASRQELDDLEEDLDFLGPSSDVENSARRPRNTQTAQKDARQQALEKLKQQRSGLQPTQPQLIEDDEESTEDDELYGEDEEDQAQPVSSRQFFQEDDYDEEFIEEDGEGDDPLGFPDGDIPLEFTRYASMKPKELFKYAVEWMVQKKINPAFQMNDGIYDLTFRKLDDEVKGLAGSKFKSSVWTPDFTTSLNSRPDIAYEPIDRDSDEHFMRDHCDACNRTNHPATFQIQFQGKPYHAETLEEVAGNEDDDEDDSSSENEGRDSGDSPDYNAQGREVPPANTIYYVGKFCMSNAQTAHALQHWRYHLNEWVVSWVIRNGYNTPEKIVERDRWSTKKRRKYANKIADRMEQEGVVKTLWRDFRENIDDARNSKQGRYRLTSP